MPTINSINNKTGPLTITDSSDTSKAIVFDVSAVSTGTTKTFTMDDRNIDFDAVPTTVGTDGSDCTPVAGKFNIVGTGTTTTSAVGDTITVNSSGVSALSVAFLSRLQSTASNVTGAGSGYFLGSTVNLTNIFDLGGNFDDTTGYFTAPATAKYQFNFCVHVQGMVNATLLTASIWATGQTFEIMYDPNGSPQKGELLTILVGLAAGDTCRFLINVTGEAGDICDLPGSTARTFISGFLVA